MPNMKGIKMDIGELDLPYQRVVLVTDLHWATTVPELFKFFRGFNVIDIKRGVDTESGKSTTAYVLLSSMKEVVRAHLELDMEQIRGRAQVHQSLAPATFPNPVFTVIESGPFNEQRLSVDNEVQVKPMADMDGLAYSPVSSVSPVSPVSAFGPVEVGSHPGLHQKVLQALGSSEWYKPITLSTNPIPMEPWTHKTINEPAPDMYYIPGLQDINLPKEPIMYSSPASTSSSSSSNIQVDFENPKQRVLVIANLHPNVKVNDLRPFFSGLEIVDFKRSVNHKTGKAAPIGFVLFRTIQERITAHTENNGRLLFGRPVRLETGHNVTVWNTGFTRPNTALDSFNTPSPPRYPTHPTMHNTPIKAAAMTATIMKSMTPPTLTTTSLNPGATTFTTPSKPSILPIISPMTAISPKDLISPLDLTSPINPPPAPYNTPTNPTFNHLPSTPMNRTTRVSISSSSTPPSFQPPFHLFSSPESESASDGPVSPASSITSSSSHCVVDGGVRVSSGYCYKDLEALSFDDDNNDNDVAANNTIEEEIAMELFGPWNLAGKDSLDPKYNVITEEEWYRFAVENGVLSFEEVYEVVEEEVEGEGGSSVWESYEEEEEDDEDEVVDDDTEWEHEYDLQMWVAEE
ncbi:hypothetical protein DM02DRAFT_626370 [Periconia macrospinosa]|uniref:RRM domain-containing protein n=1 Tax=Periconia macrospinosa TaxID=97972 RepID=A0A2V1DWT7_9PLEO|nr:hypothetical protein DM02DRAFT_626370 [Periconia macrospinosa]